MRRNKNSARVLIAVTAGVLATLTTLYGQHSGGGANASQDEATSVQEGAMTERQRKHSRLFELRGGKRLEEHAPASEDVNFGHEVPFRLTAPFPGTRKYMQDLACESDAVIVGTVRSKTSQLTEGGTNIFTDYELTVEEVMKSNAPLRVDDDITVTRFGGAVRLNGRLLRVDADTELPLKVGKRYLLFIKSVPETGAYRSATFTGDKSFLAGENSFLINGNKVSHVSKDKLPFGDNVAVDAATFLGEVRLALKDGCSS